MADNVIPLENNDLTKTIESLKQELPNNNNNSKTNPALSEEFEKYKLHVELFKWLIGTVGLAVVTAIINWGFKDREKGLLEIAQYDKYATDLIILNKDPYNRRMLAQYFSFVTPSKKLKTGWKDYFKEVDLEYHKFITDDSIAKAKKAVLDTTQNKTASQKLESQKLEEVIIKNNEIIEQPIVTPISNAANVNKERYIIVGTDNTLLSAQDELKKALKISMNSKIVFRENKYRTVILGIFDKDEALRMLSLARVNINSGSYIVFAKSWCNQLTQGDKCMECK